jgi:transcriptional activator SPT8
MEDAHHFTGSASSDDDQNEQMDELEDAEGDGDVDNEIEEEEEEEEDLENGDDDNGDDTQTYSNGQNTQAYYENQGGRNQASGSKSSEQSNLMNNIPSLPPTSQPGPTLLLTSPSPQRSPTASGSASLELPRIRPEALTAPVYDIVPTIAAPHSTSINAITATPDLRWVFSGGTDGYIRKFNWIETANGKVMLTVAQRHPFVDSVTKAGVLTSYWENEEPHGTIEYNIL